jgi:predicted XRE-type DNA-binding protein
LYTIFNIINMEEKISLKQQELNLLKIAKEKLAIILNNESEKGICQKYLGKILGIDQPKISMAMKAKGSFSLSKIICLIARLGKHVVIDTSQSQIEKIFIVIDSKNPTHAMEHWASKNIIYHVKKQ